MFYGWQRALFERAPQVFVESRATPAETVKRELGGKVEHLKAKLLKKDAVIAELSEALVDLRKSSGSLNGRWVPHDIRDEVIDFVADWSEKTELAPARFALWLRIQRSQLTR